jgi:hypothetical protein
MNKEQQELLDKSYENFSNKAKGLNLYLEVNKDIVVAEGPVYNAHPRLLTQEEFINKCKTDTEFSENWGLKIEERELSPKERIELAGGKIQEKYPALIEMSLRVCDERDIPTRLIIVTYNDKIIESYE